MFKSLKTIAVLTLALLASASQAAPVLLGSVSKTYGSSSGQTANYTGSSSCVKAGSVSVYDSASNCGDRFSDNFDFSGIAADSISSLQLTLDFSATNNLWMVIFWEDWHVRPASGSVGSVNLFDMSNRSGLHTQLFTFTDANLDLFDDIVATGNFGLWFAEQSWASHNFNLMSARLDVIGTPAEADNAVPEPSALALAGLALLALGWSRRRSAR